MFRLDVRRRRVLRGTRWYPMSRDGTRRCLFSVSGRLEDDESRRVPHRHHSWQKSFHDGRVQCPVDRTFRYGTEVSSGSYINIPPLLSTKIETQNLSV